MNEKKKEIPDGPNLTELRRVIKKLNKATDAKIKRATKLTNRNKTAGKNLRSNIKVAKAMTSELSGLIENCDKGKDPRYVNSFEKESLVKNPKTGVDEIKIAYILDVEIPDLVNKIIGDVTNIFVTYDYFWYSRPKILTS